MNCKKVSEKVCSICLMKADKLIQIEFDEYTIKNICSDCLISLDRIIKRKENEQYLGKIELAGYQTEDLDIVIRKNYYPNSIIINKTSDTIRWNFAQFDRYITNISEAIIKTWIWIADNHPIRFDEEENE